ncbi:xanthine dehydrogenase family protein molybdopterin-binding subunit [Marinobacter caseinilyticus]|uniref:xanthine dehydrogenase family protein molybdopterin-binding subunit n=1 Tax=Marinobacter caseinilyticus TaxID=2692195 RepID=UPI0014090BE7|nr:xanthine dehydrogenase family protein molybdopterin-binding subunit [Marinobacter caseinilyticus]
MEMNRRDFLKTSITGSGGLLLALSLPGCASVETGYNADQQSWVPNAWLELTADDDIFFTLARVEMGQGTYTGLTTLIAEELDVPPNRIQPRFAPAAPEYRNPLYKLQLTGGSTSLSTSWEPLRVAGASAHRMLVSAAAKVWKVESSQCRTREGRVLHPNGQDSLAYGQLVALAAVEPVPSAPTLKTPDQWQYIGQPMQRLDAHAKVTGTAEYGIDVELPGMVYAVVTRPPRVGGRVKSFDANGVRTMPGVIEVFEIDRGVAIVADKYWRARKAQQALTVVWDDSDALTLSSADVMTHYRTAADADGGESERSQGDMAMALATADDVLNVSYEQPFLAHATLEPMNATAHYTDGHIDVWAPTQAPDLGCIAAARATDLSPDEVTVHTTFIGGGFGRRLTQDYIGEVAAVAYRVKRPVKLLWSREEDTRHDWYRPAMLHRLQASLKDGDMTGWQHQIVGPQILDWYVRDAAPAQYPWAPKFLYNTLGSVGLMAEGIATPKDMSAIEGAVDYPYGVDNLSIRHTHTDAGIPVTWWRSVGHSHNGFAVETFMDEIAHKLGQDPLAFRRQRLEREPRHLAVLERAAELGDWGRPLPAGRARGIALHRSFGTYVAQVVEASIRAGEIHVHRVACAVDCGQVVNPEIVRDQMESGILFGLTAALYGQITFENGAVQESNFHDYRLLRVNAKPEMVVEIIDSAAPPSGVGEPGLPPVIPALGNALFALTGERQRQLPLRA